MLIARPTGLISIIVTACGLAMMMMVAPSVAQDGTICGTGKYPLSEEIFADSHSSSISGSISNFLAGGRTDHAAWHTDFQSLCLPGKGIIPVTEAQKITLDLVEQLENLDPQQDPLLSKMREYGTALCIDDRPSAARGYFDTEFNLIGLKNSLTYNEQLAIFVHELRHLDQFSRGFYPSTNYDIREMVRFAFAMEADAQAITTFYAWQLKETGYPEVWNALSLFDNYADISARFAAEMKQGASVGDATNAAFEQWYTSEWRINNYYVAACNNYLDKVDETKNLLSYQLLPNDYFETLCILSDGSNYSCDEAANLLLAPGLDWTQITK